MMDRPGRLAGACALLLVLTGCSGPLFAPRPPLINEQGWFLRLETYGDPQRAAQVQFDHPADLAEADLAAILGRLLMQDRVASLSRKPAPELVFTPAETAQLAPYLSRAFKAAGPTEWIGFALTNYDGPAPRTTSGAFFIKDRRLHVLIANWLEPIASGRDGIGTVRANPLRPVKKRDQVLAFDGHGYVVSVAQSWMSEDGAPAAAEMVLDHRAFLSALRAQEQAKRAAAAPAQTPAADREAPSLPQQLSTLQAENERLKKQLEAQAAELERLKAQLAGPKAKPPAKKPAR
jgi:hypothetical protein